MDQKGTFEPSDTNYPGALLEDPWHGLMGTPNGRAVAYFLQDHQADLPGVKILKIHTWPSLSEAGGKGAMIFELGR